MTRGEVWWGDLPEVGRRPFLVLTRDQAISVLTRVLVVPATRTVRGIGSEVELGRADGMPDDCVLNLDNVEAMVKAFLTERITRLSPERMRDVCRALNFAAGCR